MEKTFKKQLKTRAILLKPVIILGQHGLTEAVHAEIDRALYDHELIKIKVNQQPREVVQAFAEEVATHHQAELIHRIGHTAIFYRKSDKASQPKNAEKPAKKKVVKKRGVKQGIKDNLRKEQLERRPSKRKPMRSVTKR